MGSLEQNPSETGRVGVMSLKLQWASPISSSCEDAVLVVLSQDHRDGPLVTGHLWALPYHKLDEPPAPHQQAAILCTTQHLRPTTIHLHPLADRYTCTYTAVGLPVAGCCPKTFALGSLLS